MDISDIDFNKFEILRPIMRGQDSWSQTITYDGVELEVKFPKASCTFPLNEYKYEEKKQSKYSLNITLNDIKDGHDELQTLLEDIDQNVQDLYKTNHPDDNWTFVSSIKEPKDKKYKPMLRVKLVSNSKRFKCDIFENGKKLKDKTIAKIKPKIVRGTEVELICKLNPIWKVKNRFGVSWQIVGLNIITKNTTYKFSNKEEIFNNTSKPVTTEAIPIVPMPVIINNKPPTTPSVQKPNLFRTKRKIASKN